MAERPIFVPSPESAELVREVFLPLRWHPGFAAAQKEKNIKALHEAAAAAGYKNILEVSTKSDRQRGQHLSAFYLRVKNERLGEMPLECAFQGSKVFERGGPFTDLYCVEPRVAKRDPRLRESGALVAFKFDGFEWPLEPKTAFYDWLYIGSVFPYRDWAVKLFAYGGFSDIEFNPFRSINCQARSLALFLSLLRRGVLERAVQSPRDFLRVLDETAYRPDLRTEDRTPELFQESNRATATHGKSRDPIIVSIFGDESSDETHERVFSVAGLVGTDEEWAEAEALWRDVTRGEEFHAAEWEHAKRFDDYKAATQALIASRVAGVVMSMDLRAFRSVIPDQLPDAGYYACFSKLISGMSREWHLWNERALANPEGGDPQVAQVRFTFDHRKESGSNAGCIYAALKDMDKPERSRLLGADVSFDSRKNPRIQMADLVAREAMKDLDRRVVSKSYSKRKSMIALEESGHFKFIEFHRDYFERLAAYVANIDRNEEFLRRYREWLINTGRVQNGHVHDTWANRSAFLVSVSPPGSL